MNKINLDILIVYSDLAVSASIDDPSNDHPFPLNSKQANYNQSYEYFLEYCQKKNLTAGLSTSGDIVGPGTCSSFWAYESGSWVKNNSKVKSTQIFDKMSPHTDDQMNKQLLLLSDESIKPFTDKKLLNTFFDKLVTYQQLSEFAIPTVAIDDKKTTSIDESIAELEKITNAHQNNSDFQKGFVLKDRFGTGGNSVYKIENDFAENIRKIINKSTNVQFILQPFIEFDKGFEYKGNYASTDIRLIFQNDNLFQCYFRIAKPGDFRCNEHLGGDLIYVTKNDIPESIKLVAEKIVQKINKPRSLYALDFIVSNTKNIYLIEGNNHPGIDWDSNKEMNKIRSKELIESIIEEFIYRIKLVRGLK